VDTSWDRRRGFLQSALLEEIIELQLAGEEHAFLKVKLAEMRREIGVSTRYAFEDEPRSLDPLSGYFHLPSQGEDMRDRVARPEREFLR
jgi:hypothetical protein